jgi:hypothetical protein
MGVWEWVDRGAAIRVARIPKEKPAAPRRCGPGHDGAAVPVLDKSQLTRPAGDPKMASRCVEQH